jgi:hypothetical protein
MSILGIDIRLLPVFSHGLFSAPVQRALASTVVRAVSVNPRRF